jgi:hypothetical protein
MIFTRTCCRNLLEVIVELRGGAVVARRSHNPEVVVRIHPPQPMLRFVTLISIHPFDISKKANNFMA